MAYLHVTPGPPPLGYPGQGSQPSWAAQSHLWHSHPQGSIRPLLRQLPPPHPHANRGACQLTITCKNWSSRRARRRPRGDRPSSMASSPPASGYSASKRRGAGAQLSPPVLETLAPLKRKHPSPRLCSSKRRHSARAPRPASSCWQATRCFSSLHMVRPSPLLLSPPPPGASGNLCGAFRARSTFGAGRGLREGGGGSGRSQPDGRRELRGHSAHHSLCAPAN